MRWLVARYLDDKPNSCLAIANNRVVFLLLTLKGDPIWHYHVDELHPRAHDLRPWRKRWWCDWELMGMDIEDLINYLRLEGSHDLEHIPVASEEDAPPPADEFTDEDGGPKEEGDDPTEAG